MAVVSASLGWLIRPADPLDQPPRTQSPIYSRPTAADQYNLALQSFPEDEDAWKAVIDRFRGPADKVYRYQAMEQLGLLYLRTQKFDQAEQVFEDMSQLKGGELEAKYKTKALAGQIVVADLRGETERVGELLEELQSQKLDYRSRLGGYVEAIIQRRRSQSDEGDSE